MSESYLDLGVLLPVEMEGWKDATRAREEVTKRVQEAIDECLREAGIEASKADARIWEITDPEGKPIAEIKVRDCDASFNEEGWVDLPTKGRGRAWIEIYAVYHLQTEEKADRDERVATVTRIYLGPSDALLETLNRVIKEKLPIDLQSAGKQMRNYNEVIQAAARRARLEGSTRVSFPVG